MLKSLDILIGLIVILLALSMAVTLVTQVISTAVNRRGRDLRRGLVDLLQELDPVLTLEHSEKIATEILTHPLVSGSRTSWTGHRRVGRTLQLERLDPSLPNTVRQNAPILQEAGSDRTSQRFTVVLARKKMSNGRRASPWTRARRQPSRTCSPWPENAATWPRWVSGNADENLPAFTILRLGIARSLLCLSRRIGR